MWCGESTRAGPRNRQTEHEAQRDVSAHLRQHPADDLATAGTKRHADTDLARPLRDDG